VKNIARKSNEPSSETLAHVSQRLSLLDRHNEMHVHRTRFVLDRFDTSCRCETSHDKPRNWHADSSRRSVVHLIRERIAPRDLEPNLSQMSHLVQFISEPVIFICKQLKRPVAFGAAQEDGSLLPNSSAVGIRVERTPAAPFHPVVNWWSPQGHLSEFRVQTLDNPHCELIGC